MAEYDKTQGGYRIFIGDLGHRIGKFDIEREFDKYGPIVDTWVARDPPGFAFVVYKYGDDAEQAVRDRHGRTVCGRRVRVEHARPFSERKKDINNSSRYRGGGARNYSPRRYSRSHSRERRRRRRSYSRSRSRSRDSRRRSKRSRTRSRSRSRDRSRRHSDSKRSKSRRSRSSSRSRKSRSKSPTKKSASAERKSTSKSRSRSKSREKEDERRSQSKEKEIKDNDGNIDAQETENKENQVEENVEELGNVDPGNGHGKERENEDEEEGVANINMEEFIELNDTSGKSEDANEVEEEGDHGKEGIFDGAQEEGKEENESTQVEEIGVPDLPYLPEVTPNIEAD